MKVWIVTYEDTDSFYIASVHSTEESAVKAADVLNGDSMNPNFSAAPWVVQA